MNAKKTSRWKRVRLILTLFWEDLSDIFWKISSNFRSIRRYESSSLKINDKFYKDIISFFWIFLFFKFFLVIVAILFPLWCAYRIRYFPHFHTKFLIIHSFSNINQCFEPRINKGSEIFHFFRWIWSFYPCFWSIFSSIWRAFHCSIK